MFLPTQHVNLLTCTRYLRDGVGWGGLGIMPFLLTCTHTHTHLMLDVHQVHTLDAHRSRHLPLNDRSCTVTCMLDFGQDPSRQFLCYLIHKTHIGRRLELEHSKDAPRTSMWKWNRRSPLKSPCLFRQGIFHFCAKFLSLGCISILHLMRWQCGPCTFLWVNP